MSPPPRSAERRRRSAAGVAYLLPLYLVACWSCGVKAPPRPPEDVRPQTVSDLRGTNVDTGIQLTWSRPRTYADGTPMNDLAGFVIERADVADPHPVFKQLTTLEVSDRDRFRQLKQFHHIDTAVSRGATYAYRVVSFTLDRYFSTPSNVATVERTAMDEEKHASFPAPQR